ncbi:unnamed protein product [Cylicostephanus goldi]|uniref:Uncharacterized protein n=1 Tax=Cylicostephanus goldi TaxID=71465 RepID=A0A3P7NND7_CYLGO|nr:unnamed protein product [Cylicostephanus goldi]
MCNPDRSMDEKRNEMAADLKMKESLIDEMTASIAEYQKKTEELMKENTELRETLQTMEAERTRNARLIEMYRNQQRAVASRYVGVSPPVNPGFPSTSPFFNGRSRMFWEELWYEIEFPLGVLSLDWFFLLAIEYSVSDTVHANYAARHQ